MKQVLIAGISGAIGHAIAERLLRQDSELVIVGLCRDPSSVRFAEEQADRVTLIPWDAAEAGNVDGVAEKLKESLPAESGLDTVIYAAGILHGPGMSPEKRLEDLDAGAFAHAFAVNATGFAMLVRTLAPWLRHRRFKRIVAVSAKVGSITDNGFGGWYAYRSSKAALNMLVRNLSIELPRKYRPLACVAVHPGTTLSPLSEPFTRSLAQLKVHEPGDTAENILRVTEQLTEENNGTFLSWDGSVIPW
ncbi:short-chain dehydrogenase [Marinobacter vulgaris]|uniref:Short-chain dehydrogenase n=1 Tax=Marinobacter vulgaris TaxID=1928331 RepID=A0A2V3ZLI6_9GAMM|nr:SDR family NAD(P)-dependent oxidoreductase [Marinobacter vulgaris]PXX92255.1 short-chain dehydrogenase [Marinobacter vulgaris]TSJ71802.1 SDR family NAD(P)-dependent oxidoreductase [Marinobacter vulgaris]